MKASKLVRISAALITLLFTGKIGRSQTTVTLDSTSPSQTARNLGDPRPAVPSTVPIICKEPTSGTVLYVESDHRHVCAISQEGKVLWCRDPLADADIHYNDINGLPLHLKIMGIRASADGKHVILPCEWSLTGAIDIATGNYESWIKD